MTARSSGSSRWGCRSAACNARCRPRRASSRLRSIRSSARSARRSPTCVRSRQEFVLRAWTTGLRPRCKTSRARRPSRSTWRRPIGRVAASVEAAAYFVVCEALTNAVKHASASRVSLSATSENGSLLVSVTDDGIGGALARRGSGLAGLGDRISAHGGTLVIASPRGGGTRIEVVIPCDS